MVANQATNEPSALAPESKGVFWRNADGKYALYLKGRAIAPETENAWSNEDLLVYYPDNDTHYLLEGFKQRTDGELRPATAVGSGELPLWRNVEGRCAIYFKGRHIAGETENAWSNDDLVVYYPANETLYLLENFNGHQDGILRPAKVIGDGERAYWRKTAGKYAIYWRGRAIHGDTEGSRSNGDVIAYHKPDGTSYLLESFDQISDGELRPARILEE
jgi:hypothetical protein